MIEQELAAVEQAPVDVGEGLAGVFVFLYEGRESLEFLFPRFAGEGGQVEGFDFLVI